MKIAAYARMHPEGRIDQPGWLGQLEAIQLWANLHDHHVVHAAIETEYSPFKKYWTALEAMLQTTVWDRCPFEAIVVYSNSCLWPRTGTRQDVYDVMKIYRIKLVTLYTLL